MSNIAAKLLFTITNEIKRSLETPVILLTREDFADNVFNTLVELRNVLQSEDTALVMEVINNYHVNWLRAVRDLYKIKERNNILPRELIYSAVEYSINCVKARFTHCKKYIERHTKILTLDEIQCLRTDIEIIDEMQVSVIGVLNEKLTCFRYQADHTEFALKVGHELEELMRWLDSLYNSLTQQCCDVIFNPPDIRSDLAAVLKNVIFDVAMTDDERMVKFKTNAKKTCLKPSILAHDLEIEKVKAKIQVIDDKLEKMKLALKDHSSATEMALQHKKLYLEERLQNLRDMNAAIQTLKKSANEDDNTAIAGEIRIFSHVLPEDDRNHLIDELLNAWFCSLHGCRRKYRSLISILSVSQTKEMDKDENGYFFFDIYGRKIYVQDEHLYQMNERNELVELRDNEKHAYFYDDCGRYYIEDHTRVYKCDFDENTDYVLVPPGVMVKYREEIDGIEYRYDNIGRFYIDSFGDKIYREKDAESIYENDGFGNLVKIRDQDVQCNVTPEEPMAMPESKYLRQVVGPALQKCLADVVLHQPKDPIAFLADGLEKYRANSEERCQGKQNEEEMLVEKEFYKCEHPAEQEVAMEASACESSYDSVYSYDTTVRSEAAG